MVWNCTDIVPGSLFDWLTLIVLFRGEPDTVRRPSQNAGLYAFQKVLTKRHMRRRDFITRDPRAFSAIGNLPSGPQPWTTQGRLR
jgi:hypothetical protein